MTTRGLPGSEALCDTAVQMLTADGALLVIKDRSSAQLLHSSDEIAKRWHDLEFVTGEGPCAAADTHRRSVIGIDLRTEVASTRWPWFAREATEIGLIEVFAYPIVLSSEVLLVLGVYRRRPGPATDRQGIAVRNLCLAASSLLLPELRGHFALDDEDDSAAELPWGSTETEQALGMIAESRHGTMTEARTLLRGTAFAESRPAYEIARDVLDGRISYHTDQPG